jgi:4-amino-4-deoxy-L-arabinose transferase-like glycosyltransferase
MERQQVTARLMPFRLNDTATGRLLSWVSASHFRSITALILIALACYLPGLAAIPPIDRDEARFAQATKQMMETGNYIDIRIGDEARYKKPIGIYWLQAALVKATGQGTDAPIWAYRLASLFGALSAVLLTYWATLPLFGPRAGFMAAASLAVSLVLTSEAHLAKTDAVLLATIVLMMGSLVRVYLWDHPGRPSLWTSLGFWVGLGLSILVKGPIGPMVAALTIVSLVLIERRFAWLSSLRPLVGVPVVLAIVLPWFVAILSIAGSDFIKQSIGTDMFGKVGTGQEGHGAPPGAHFLLFWVVFWPATLLVPLAARWVWRHRSEPEIRFCLAWLVPSWLVFEAVATKLPHYTLPVLPAIAAMVGSAVVYGGVEVGRWWTRALAVPVAIIAVAIPLGAAGALYWLEGVLSVAAILLTLVTAALALAAVAASFRDAPLTAAALLAASAIPVYWATFGVVAPEMRSLQLSPRLVDAAKHLAPCPELQIASSGFEEPSLIFLAGTGTRFVDGPGAAEFLANRGCRVALIAASEEPQFADRAKTLKLSLVRGQTVSGINIARARQVSLTAYRTAGPL